MVMKIKGMTFPNIPVPDFGISLMPPNPIIKGPTKVTKDNQDVILSGGDKDENNTATITLKFGWKHVATLVTMSSTDASLKHTFTNVTTATESRQTAFGTSVGLSLSASAGVEGLGSITTTVNTTFSDDLSEELKQSSFSGTEQSVEITQLPAYSATQVWQPVVTYETNTGIVTEQKVNHFHHHTFPIYYKQKPVVRVAIKAGGGYYDLPFPTYDEGSLTPNTNATLVVPGQAQISPKASLQIQSLRKWWDYYGNGWGYSKAGTSIQPGVGLDGYTNDHYWANVWIDDLDSAPRIPSRLEAEKGLPSPAFKILDGHQWRDYEPGYPSASGELTHNNGPFMYLVTDADYNGKKFAYKVRDEWRMIANGGIPLWYLEANGNPRTTQDITTTFKWHIEDSTDGNSAQNLTFDRFRGIDTEQSNTEKFSESIGVSVEGSVGDLFSISATLETSFTSSTTTTYGLEVNEQETFTFDVPVPAPADGVSDKGSALLSLTTTYECDGNAIVNVENVIFQWDTEAVPS